MVGPALFFPWGPYCARALEQLGHPVDYFLCSDLWVDRLTLRRGRQWVRTCPPVADSLDRWRTRWLKDRDRRLLRRIREGRYDLLLVLRGETLSASLLQEVKRIFSGPLVTWWVDDPLRYRGLELAPFYDLFFIFDRSYIGPLEEQGCQHVKFLPCACDETVYRPQTLSRAEQKRYRSDIALVGWYYPDRSQVLRALEGLDVKIWGRGWKRSGFPCRERFVADEEASRIYNAASIGLNIHSDQSRQAGLNTRSFELLAAGTFELTDYVEGMEELLTPNREVAVYRSAAEARERAEYYLRHPEIREEILRRGRERVLREHTYRHRMQTLLKSVQENTS